ncbi:MAG: undecaprenyldiphospho-muramoylpentapeptide beta-N-acetylglucosaminyltransferase [Alphaproteobacteria bacterium]
MMENQAIVFAAGGTGGHMYPAITTLEDLSTQHDNLHLVTDHRGAKHLPNKSSFNVHHIKTPAVMTTDLWNRIQAVLMLGLSFFQMIKLLWRLKPKIIVGFGGHPATAVLLAAKVLRIPYGLHEQNAYVGMVNRFFAPKATFLALSFEDTQAIPTDTHTVYTGLPVRDEFYQNHEKPQDDYFRLFIIGGSLGAYVFSKQLPKALAMLPPAMRSQIKVVQQCRADDLESTREAYQKIDVAAELDTFIPDPYTKMFEADVVIARAGASTCAELAVTGTPAIFVPYPYATDDHQYYNAKYFVDSGAGWLYRQEDFTAEAVSELMQNLMNNPHIIEKAKGSYPQSAKNSRSLLRKYISDFLNI